LREDEGAVLCGDRDEDLGFTVVEVDRDFVVWGHEDAITCIE
jgi:hypothetical protein